MPIILVVDDSLSVRKVAERMLKEAGLEVALAANGEEAYEKAKALEKKPDLIMMDVRLPGMNGDEATARLKANRSTRNIPVVINTGWTTACNVEERINRALNAGAVEILYKPFQWPMLRDVLRTYLLA